MSVLYLLTFTFGCQFVAIGSALLKNTLWLALVLKVIGPKVLASVFAKVEYKTELRVANQNAMYPIMCKYDG